MLENLEETDDQQPVKEKELNIIDVSEKFESMDALSFLAELRKYRTQAVHLNISVPWKGDYFLGIRLKAFIEGRTGEQKRTAIIRGTSEELQQALEMEQMPNVLHSGVRWELTD